MRIKKGILLGISLILILSVLFVFGCAKPAPAPAPAPKPTQVITWELYAADTPGNSLAVRMWQQELIDQVYNLSEGRLKIELFALGEHPYKDTQMIQLMKELNPELVEFPYVKLSGQDPKLGVTDVPYLYPPNLALYYKVLDEQVMPRYLQPIIGDYGYQSLMTIAYPPKRLGGKDFFVTDWSSLKGKKVRVFNPQLADLVTMLGGIPVSIAWAEVYTSLQTGVIDGVITDSGAMYSAKLYEVVKSLTPMEISFGCSGFLMRKDALQALPNDLKDKLLNWAKDVEPGMRDRNASFYDTATLKGVVEYGVSIKPPSSTFFDEIRNKSWETVWKPWIERSGGAGSTIADAFNTLAKVLIEKGYTVPNYKPY